MSASSRAAVSRARSSAPGSSGIGEVHRGEVRVRLRLFRDERDVGETCGVQHGHRRFPAHAVHGGQDDLQPAGREVLRSRQGRDGVLVLGGDGGLQHGPAVRGQDDGIQGADGVDPRRNQGIVRGHDLGAAAALLDGMTAEVHLVAVVLRRVVAGGDHDAAVAVQRPHRVGEQRGGQRGRHQEGFNSGSGEDRGGFFGENIGVVAGVEADDGARPGAGGGLRDRVGEERGETGSGAAHHHPVHPVRPRAEGCPQSGGAELQGAAETVGQLLAGRRDAAVGEADQLGQGGGSGGVRVLVCPVAGIAQEPGEFGIRRRHRNQTIANRARFRPSNRELGFQLHHARAERRIQAGP